MDWLSLYEKEKARLLEYHIPLWVKGGRYKDVQAGIDYYEPKVIDECYDQEQKSGCFIIRTQGHKHGAREYPFPLFAYRVDKLGQSIGAVFTSHSKNEDDIPEQMNTRNILSRSLLSNLTNAKTVAY
jgi:hypothetical protein